MMTPTQNSGWEEGAASLAQAGDKPNSVDPEALIAGLSRPRMTRMVGYSFLIHVAVILLTSVGFISLCVKYQSLHPRRVVEKLEKEAAEKQMQTEAAQAAQAAVQAAPAAADARPEAAASTPAPQGDAPPPTGEAQREKSRIEQEVEKTSAERPTAPSISLDQTPDLE